MPLFVSYYVIVLAGFTLLVSMVKTYENWVEHHCQRAKNRLLTYLNIGEGTYDHSRNDLWDRTGVIEASLVAHAHAKAKRGMYLARELSRAGAITEAKRDYALAFFRKYLDENRCKKAVPKRLPEMEIDTQDDPTADVAAEHWEKFGNDLAELRWILRSFSIAFDRDRIDLGG